MGRREEIARIIDPEAFRLIAHYNGLSGGSEERTFREYPQLRERRDGAFVRAAQIRAMMDSLIADTAFKLTRLEIKHERAVKYWRKAVADREALKAANRELRRAGRS